MSRASLIEDMVESGLRFHHAKGDTANLCLWLDEDNDCKIPEYATHHVVRQICCIVGHFFVWSVNELISLLFVSAKPPGRWCARGEQSR